MVDRHRSFIATRKKSASPTKCGLVNALGETTVYHVLEPGIEKICFHLKVSDSRKGKEYITTGKNRDSQKGKGFTILEGYIRIS